MVRRAEPLVVDIFVTTLARIGLHEELAGNFLLAIDLRGTRKERARRPIALAVHVVGRHRGILDAAPRLPTLSYVTSAIADSGEPNQADCGAQNGSRGVRGQPSTLSQLAREQKTDSDQRDHDVEIEPFPLSARRSGFNKNDSEHSACSHQQPSRAGQKVSIPQ